MKSYNKGYRYLLTVVDVFSKYAWVRPLKDKTGGAVVKAFRSIFDEGRKPLRLQTDDGKEFYNKVVQELLRKSNVHHFSTSGDAKASVVERFNRTLKSRMYRYFTAKNTLRYDSLTVSSDGIQCNTTQKYWDIAQRCNHT